MIGQLLPVTCKKLPICGLWPNKGYNMFYADEA